MGEMRIKQVILSVFWIVTGYNLWDLVIGTKNIPWWSEAITLASVIFVVGREWAGRRKG